MKYPPFFKIMDMKTMKLAQSNWKVIDNDEKNKIIQIAKYYLKHQENEYLNSLNLLLRAI